MGDRHIEDCCEIEKENPLKRKHNSLFCELKNTLRRIESTNAKRHEAMIENHNVLIDQIRAMHDETISIFQQVMSSTSDDGANKIVKRIDFKMPAFPMLTRKQVFDLNANLKQAKYRDQLVFVSVKYVKII